MKREKETRRLQFLGDSISKATGSVLAQNSVQPVLTANVTATVITIIIIILFTSCWPARTDNLDIQYDIEIAGWVSLYGFKT